MLLLPKNLLNTPVFTGFSRNFINFSQRIFDLLQIVPEPVDTARNRCLRSLKKDPLGRFENQKTSINQALGRFEAKNRPPQPCGGRKFPTVGRALRCTPSDPSAPWLLLLTF